MNCARRDLCGGSPEMGIPTAMIGAAREKSSVKTCLQLLEVFVCNLLPLWYAVPVPRTGLPINFGVYRDSSG